MLGLGNNLNELKTRVQKAKEDLAQIGAYEEHLPEMINMTNLLRANEFLAKTDEKKSELIAAYSEYSERLEQIVSSLLSIQEDLRDIIKTEASLIGSEHSAKTRKGAKKPKK